MIETDVLVVGSGPAGGASGCDAQDVYGDWYRTCEVEEDGCVVVRPDMHVCWRAATIAPNPDAALAAMFERVLGLAST